MIPGIVSKLSESVVASAATIDPSTEIIRLTGTTNIVNIVPPGTGLSTILFLIPTGGNVATTAAGNIATAQTMLNNQLTIAVYSRAANKWYLHALA